MHDASNPLEQIELETAYTEKTDPVTPAPKELTLSEFKKLRRMYVTIKHPRIAECNHKYTGNIPKTNCEWCWFTYLNEHGELIKSLDEGFRKDGPAMIINIFGEKFFKMWLRFMATVAKFTQEDATKEVANAENEKSETIEETQTVA